MRSSIKRETEALRMQLDNECVGRVKETTSKTGRKTRRKTKPRSTPRQVEGWFLAIPRNMAYDEVHTEVVRWCNDNGLSLDGEKVR